MTVMKIKKPWIDPDIEIIDVASTLAGGGDWDDHDVSKSPPPSS